MNKIIVGLIMTGWLGFLAASFVKDPLFSIFISGFAFGMATWMAVVEENMREKK